MSKEIKDAMKEDSGYRYGWQANIAMSFYDEFDEHSDEIHMKANNAADKFLNLLCRDRDER